jgi:hypothetical protein
MADFSCAAFLGTAYSPLPTSHAGFSTIMQEVCLGPCGASQTVDSGRNEKKGAKVNMAAISGRAAAVADALAAAELPAGTFAILQGSVSDYNNQLEAVKDHVELLTVAAVDAATERDERTVRRRGTAAAPLRLTWVGARAGR